MILNSIIKPKRPKNPQWKEFNSAAFSFGYASYGFTHPNGTCVISAVEVAKDTNGFSRGPEYHISISQNGKRCSSREAAWALQQFGFDLDSVEEDNHIGGIARNFWIPVAENLIGLECPCKKTESIVKENKGDYIWRPLDDDAHNN